MSRLNELPSSPIDQIMIANAGWPAYRGEHPGAVNTTVGVLVDPNHSQPWQPRAVKEAREIALRDVIAGGTFGYQTQTGYADFTSVAAELVFGRDQYLKNPEAFAAYQTLGGTGALSLAEGVLPQLIPKNKNGKSHMVLDAGWPNHLAIFTKSFDITTYEHMDDSSGEYNHEAAKDAFASAPNGSAFLLQTCGYNDDGMDRTPEQWGDILDIAQAKEATIILDSAYLGLADGFRGDRYPIEESVRRKLLTFVCFSASKNMGLYNERVGALLVANAPEVMGQEQFKRLNQLLAREVRTTVSNTPLLAAKAAALALRQSAYYEELKEVRNTLKQNRNIFAKFVGTRLPGVTTGKGLFTKLLAAGFNAEQQDLLSRRGVYALPNSRINLGGLHRDQVEVVGAAVLDTLNLSS